MENIHNEMVNISCRYCTNDNKYKDANVGSIFHADQNLSYDENEALC